VKAFYTREGKISENAISAASAAAFAARFLLEKNTRNTEVTTTATAIICTAETLQNKMPNTFSGADTPGGVKIFEFPNSKKKFANTFEVLYSRVGQLATQLLPYTVFCRWVLENILVLKIYFRWRFLEVARADDLMALIEEPITKGENLIIFRKKIDQVSITTKLPSKNRPKLSTKST
jgi:hypothetical protein